MHHLVGGRRHLFLQPARDNAFVEVAAAQMRNRHVPGLVGDRDRNPNHLAVTRRPPGPVLFQVRVTRLKVHGNGLGMRQVG